MCIRDRINGAVIAAIITVRALPLFVSRFLRNRLRNAKKPPKPSKTPTSTTTSRMVGGSNTGIDYRSGYTPSGQRLRSGPSISRYNNSMAKYLKGTADPGDMARLFRRGFFKPFAKFTLNSKALKVLPFGIGSFIDFLIQYFVFKEPAGRAAFKAIGAGLFGFLGTLIGGPFALFTGIGGAMLGDAAGSLLYDAIFSRSSAPSAIDEYTSYDQVTDTYTTVIQPIRS